MLMMESFLTKLKFTKEEVDAAEKWIPKYIADFVSCIAWQGGNKNVIGQDPSA